MKSCAVLGQLVTLGISPPVVRDYDGIRPLPTEINWQFGWDHCSPAAWDRYVPQVDETVLPLSVQILEGRVWVK